MSLIFNRYGFCCLFFRFKCFYYIILNKNLDLYKGKNNIMT
ncbi:hypothetical protein PROSTU_03558 [Providencia stuartii ATCC 25827]|uniref:Uncharacterized protein n=1 Tax=Providencia stuartii ATCC 25827 TaxID=471874 RepID=A0AA86YM34_PROST|nr:hypothetical protein PROSTU_03558 [Providencia stuartii ATCC 25827]